LQVCLRHANSGEFGIGEGYPGDDAVVECLRLSGKHIVRDQFALSGRDMGELILTGNVTGGPDVRHIRAQDRVGRNAFVGILNTGCLKIERV
jgi:hypothetical protein